MKNKKLKTIFLTATASALGAVSLLSCNNSATETWDTNLSVNINTSWWGDQTLQQDFINEFTKNFSEEFENIKQNNEQTKNLPKVNIQFKPFADLTQSLQSLQSQSDDFSFVSHGIYSALYKKNAIDLPIPILQTQTRAFKNDTNINYDFNQLKLIAKNFNDVFNDIPYNQWSNKLEDKQKWNGSIYQFLYEDINQKVDFYRGMIMIEGTEQEKEKIKQAWNNKDWNAFKNFGIIHGKTSEFGSFKMQEFLLKKHFNLSENTFTTLSEEIQKYPNKFSNKQGYTLGQDSQYKIAFDDAVSYAWTKNDNDKTKYTSKNNEGSIEIFIVTEPLLYDLGIVRSKLPKIQQDMIQKTFINLSEKNKDLYGPLIGYNGYKPARTAEEIKSIYEKLVK